MHDPRWIRDNPEAFDRALARRGLSAMSSDVIALDQRRRAAQTEAERLQARRNEASKEIGQKRKAGENQSDALGALMAEMADIKAKLPELAAREQALVGELDALLSGIPNLPAPEVPDGADEHANVELRRIGAPPSFDFKPREHYELGEALGLMDFEAAQRLSGARFVVLRGQLARLERALAQFMLDLHTQEFGYTEIAPPLMVRDAAVYGTGSLPKFGEDLFRTREGFWLIPTAEVPLTNMVMDQIVDEAKLPLRFTAYTPCFRSEAGSAGRDTRGMLRQHQFPKVEMVSITHPDHSEAEHERMTACAEEVLKRLGLPYRVVMLSTGDMGFAARKTYDLEVWLPGQDAYREISSCSNCGEFQARRMKARFRPTGEKSNRFIHSLNGSGLAVGRTMIAVMENCQRADGSIVVPEKLRPYFGGQSEIKGAEIRA